ncbi:N-6 DNA methylase [Streptomyces sp. M10(2022)]
MGTGHTFQGGGDLAWLQHCYAHTAPGGRALVVMPASVAYRKAGRRIRAEIVRRGILTDVVALPPGMVASHAQPVHLWMLHRPDDVSGSVTSVRMVDLTASAPDGPMEPTAEQVADVPLIDLLNDSVDLTPSAHVDASRQDFPAEYRALQRGIEERLNRLTALLPALTAGEGPGTMDSATISLAELSRAGLVDLADAEPTSNSAQLDTEYLRGSCAAPPTTAVQRVAAAPIASTSRGAHPADARGGTAPLRCRLPRAQRIRGAHRRSDPACRASQHSARDGLTSGALMPPEDGA